MGAFNLLNTDENKKGSDFLPLAEQVFCIKLQK